MSTDIALREGAVPTPAASGPVIVLHVGTQLIRLPAAEVSRRLSGVVAGLDTWKARASGAELAVYGAFKAALNVGMPFVAAALGTVISAGLLPPLPPRPRHSDPVVYLLSYLVAALPFAVARGEWEVEVDAEGDVTALTWSEDRAPGVAVARTVVLEQQAAEEGR